MPTGIPSSTTGVGQRNERRLALDVGLLRPDVGDVNDFVCASETPERGLGARMNDGFATSLFDMRLRSVQRDRAEPAILAQPHDPKLGCAKAGRVRQNGIEDSLQFSGRSTDDAKHLRRRRLLLQRLGQFARSRLHLFEQPHVFNRDHRLVGKGFEQFDLFVAEGPRLRARVT